MYGASHSDIQDNIHVVRSYFIANMGAYLSEPVTEKLSSDEEGHGLKYGACSMQGWRVSQEDAHNSILAFDKDTHLFAVYDGHGGHEVATYTALKLPEVIKETQEYKDGNMGDALKTAFLTFDASLVKPEVVAALKQIAGTKEEELGEYSESESEEVDSLYREATMPLDQVMAQYSTPENPLLANCKEKKAASPFLKAKTCQDEDDKCSSSSSDVAPSTAQDTKPPKPDGDSTQDQAKQETEDIDSSEAEEKTEDAMETETESKSDNSKIDTGSKDKKEMKDSEEKTEDRGKAGDTEVNGEDKPVVNGEIEEDSNKQEQDGECKENGASLVNGGSREEVGKGKGGKGKGGKGKALLKNSEVQALKEAKAKERRREAAVKAVEIYRKLQECINEEELSEEDEEDEDDDSFEDEAGEEDGEEEDGDGEESEEEDDDEDGEETEEDDDPYSEFAMNMKEEPGFDSGCTACVALIRGQQLYVANVGDSRCVVFRDGKAVDMSLDHKPEDDPESARIIKAGGRVTADGRVNGGLNLSRAIGDHGYKQNKNLSAEEQMISPQPDLRCLTLEDTDSFMVVACDGIWNSLTSQEACDFVAERLDQDKPLSAICEELFDHCLAPNTHGDGTGCDNMTCIIITFQSSGGVGQVCSKRLVADKTTSQEDSSKKPTDKAEDSSNEPADKAEDSSNEPADKAEDSSSKRPADEAEDRPVQDSKRFKTDTQ